MKKIITAVLVTAPLVLTGCATTLDTAVVTPVVYNPYAVVYDPGYSDDYVYSLNYYNNRPYWGNNYYYYNTGYVWGTNDYWGGGFYNGY
jgi:hypothetical protein